MTAGRTANISRLNADPAFRAKVRATASEGMKRWWDGKRLPKMTAQQRWKYRTLREAYGRDVALATLFSDHAGAPVLHTPALAAIPACHGPASEFSPSAPALNSERA